MIQKNAYIYTVIDFIESNLSTEINPEMIAKKHFVSMSQLYRDFYVCIGHSIKEYIRKRRISNACEKLKRSDLPLSIIAEESGSQTQQAFHKLFKSIVGMTPLEYKQNDTYFYFYPFSMNEISIAVKVGNEDIPECTTKRFYDTRLIGIEDKAIAALGEINYRVFGRNGKQNGNQFCYEVITEKDNVCNNCSCKSGTYATCVVDYNTHDINEAWNYLYNIWISASMFEQSDDGYFEEYLFKNGKPHKLKLYLPVKKQKTTQHISISQVSEMTFVIAREKGNNAERKASERVISYLQNHYPLLVVNAQHYYVCTYDDICECGIECSGAFKLPGGNHLEILKIPSGNYATLADDCLGDIRVGKAKLDLWLTNYSIAHETKPTFAIYETLNCKYDVDNIRVRLYKRLKDDKNG
ncbi:MAG: hypothetical protein K0S47_3646 [Herbinix sp.]|jgi:AraC-like DNA-binding protein/predicted transcriptional regulator YdeE|nr:hypothetical protein [Herbinix sp.]